MQIHMAHRGKALKRYKTIQADLRLGTAVAESAKRMTGLSPSDLEAVIRSRKVVLLNGMDRESAYLAFYSVAHDAIYVVVATVTEEAHENGQPTVVDILTIADYESQGGKIKTRELRRVAAATLNPVEFRAWEHRTFGEDYERPRPRMFIHYTKSDGEDGMWSLKRVPVCDAWIDEHGMENSLGHPGVKEWLKAELERARIDPETVVAMEIVDAVKMRLRVKAEDHACPHCTLHTDSAAADHLVEATPAPAKATGGGWLSRLRTVFVGG